MSIALSWKCFMAWHALEETASSLLMCTSIYYLKWKNMHYSAPDSAGLHQFIFNTIELFG